MNRFLRLFVLQLALLGFLAGCGKDKPAQPPDNPAPPPKKGPVGAQQDKGKEKPNTPPPPPPLSP